MKERLLRLKNKILFSLVVLSFISEAAFSETLNWTTQTSAADNNWYSVTYGNGLFVAVAQGASNLVMTSPDGITWTARTSAVDNNWYGVCYGNGLFVAVSQTGTGNRVMTSPDGINWTSRTSAADNGWSSVTYGNGLFVAVSQTGTGNRVMTSPDGITWTSRTSASDNVWYSVTYGNGLFVAVASTGANRVMTSPDGINWTSRTSAAELNNWRNVCYGNGLYVAVSSTGTGNRVMTSPDGINWTARTSAADNLWYGVTYADGMFVAVSANGTGNRCMTSPDGINWTIGTTPKDNNWRSVAYGNGKFVAVSTSGIGDRVMTTTYVAAATAPTVTTQAVTSIAQTTATGNGNITNLGSDNPTAYGVCWNTTGIPTTTDSKVDKGTASATGAFTADMTGLTANTKYYVRAFATNSAGTSYGSEVTFTTLAPPAAPAVTSVTVPSNITYKIGGNLNFTVNYSEAITVNTSGGTPYIPITLNTGGVVNASYVSGSGTTALVFRYTVVAGNSDTDGISVGSAIVANGGTLKNAGALDADLTLNSVGATSGVKVDGIRPTATILLSDNALRIGETSLVTFTFSEAVTGFTNADLTIANGTLSAVSSSDGGITWTATFTPTPSITDATNVITLDNTGISDAAGNSGTGTTDSNNYAIDTTTPSSTAPTVTTQAVSDITSTNAIGNGEITSLGTSNVTAYGVCWNTTGTPTTADNKMDKGFVSLALTFPALMDGLTANTKYYVRAFATNSAGTSYGDEVTFTTATGSSAPNISYTSPQVYTKGAAITALIPSNTGGAVPASTPGTVTTLAGSGTAGSADGVGNLATFNKPVGIVCDASGNIYVSDQGNNKIRKITPEGVVTTLAGSGTAGSTNGVGAAASFWTPFHLTIDATGNLFLADFTNHMIRKITPSGEVTTFAGSGTAGSTNGVGTAASFNYPRGVVFDPSGNLFVSEYTGRKVRKITASGEVSTLAGSGNLGSVDGVGIAASFMGPNGMVADATGNLYLADYSANRIRKITPAGVVSTIAGSGASGVLDGKGSAAGFKFPSGITIDKSGTLYVVSLTGNVIQKITPDGEVKSIIGNGTAGNVDGIGLSAQLNNPYGIAFDGKSNLFVTDNGGNTIRKVSLIGYTISPSLPAGLSFDATTGTISGTPTGVSPATDYTITAFNSVGSSTAVVNIAVSDLAATAPTVTTQAVTAIAQTTATGNGNITALGSTNPTAYGVCWNTSGTPTTADSKVDKGAASATGAFSADMTGLTAGTKYYVRAFATNSAGTSYGSEVTFTTLAPAAAPAVTSVTVPSNNTYKIGGNLNFTVNFSEAITVNTSGGTPYIPITLNTGGVVNASYVSGSGTTALVFRYTVVAGNSDTDGISVGSAIVANGGTLKNAGALDADLTLNSVGATSSVKVDGIRPTATIVVADNALSVGETSLVTFTFSEAVTGFTNADLTIANGTLSAVSSADGGITWTATFTPTPSITDATNVITLDNTGISDAVGNSGTGTTDSNNYAIDTTTPSSIAPTVTTQTVTAIAQTTATGNGNITALGSVNPTAYGVCWNTTGTPTTADSKVDKGAASATGAFTADMTGLTANTKYYVRAFATNSAGTSYGDEVTFTTLVNAPSALSYSPNPVVVTVNADNVSSSPTVTGTVDSYSINPALPAGVILNTSTGVISGTPTATSPQTDYTVTATNAGGNTTATFTLTVKEAIAGLTNIVYFTEKDGLQYLDNQQIRYQYFTVPACSRYDLSTLGINVDKTSAAGKLKLGVYSAATKKLLYETAEKSVTGGIDEYISYDVPQGTVMFKPGAYAVALLANPVSGQIKISAASSFVNQGVATNIPIAAYANYLANPNTYPIFPDSMKWDYASYRALSLVVKGVDKSPVSASVSTNETVASITSNSAQSGGDVVSDGGADVIYRGVCWNKTGSPTIANSKTSNGGGIGVFTSNLTGLSASTKYYVRAYATTCVGTVYGTEVSFTTLTPVPAPSALSYSPNPVVATVNADNVSSSPAVTGTVDTYSISPALPAGVTMNTSTGVISGTPTEIAAQKDYTVTASNASGNTSAIFTLTVKDAAPTPITLSQNSVETIVNSASIYLKPTVTGSGITFSVVPALPAGVTMDPTTGIISGTPTTVMQKTTYTITATNSGGSVSTTFTIEVAPVAPTATPAQAFCGSGTVADLSAIAPAGCTVRWYDAASGGNLLAGTTALKTATSYFAESWSGAVASLTRAAVAVTINVTPAKPIITGQSTASNKVKLCPNDYIVCSNYDPALSYQWKFNGNNIAGETGDRYKVPANGAGNYTLYVKNSATGCDNISATVAVDLYSVTIPVIYEKKKSDNISILIVDNTLNLYAAYLWTYSNGSSLPSSIINNRQFLVLPPSDMSASYKVTVTDNNACTASSVSKTVTLKSVEARVYPTLVNDNFNVKLDGEGQDGALRVRIINQSGAPVRSCAFDHVQSEVAYQINSAGLAPGVYTVEVTLGSYKQTQKVVIK